MNRFLTLLLFSAAVMVGADHPAMRVTSRAVPILSVGIDRFDLAVSPAPLDPDGCPHFNMVKRWLAWRAANPLAHSRYRGGNRVLVSPALAAQVVVVRVTRANFTPQVDPEMEPYMGDPADYAAFGGCGCPLSIALKTCGWWHSQVWY